MSLKGLISLRFINYLIAITFNAYLLGNRFVWRYLSGFAISDVLEEIGCFWRK